LRRGAFDLKEDQVCHNSLLKRLMSELIADEALETSKRTLSVTDDAQFARDTAKQLREIKKQEAIERSVRRQADPQYFDRIVGQNRKPEPIADTPTESGVDCEEVPLNAETSNEKFDPFRPTYANKEKKNKIFVR
jgi:hypothetical protein